MARYTRIAVTLTLIVAITIQPSMAFALGKDCAAGCDSQFACPGCGGCQVDSAVERCGCCRGQSDIKSAEESTHCCGHKSAESHCTSSAPDERSIADAQTSAGPTAEKSSSHWAAERLRIASYTRAVESVCHCLHSPETPCVPVPRSSASEARDLASFCVGFSVVADSKKQRPCQCAFVDNLSPANFHFAQIELCVWRI